MPAWSAVFDPATENTTMVTLTGFHITVEQNDGAATPVSDARVYLFNTAGAYQGLVQTTGASGVVTYWLPDAQFKARANKSPGLPAWSPDFDAGSSSTTTVHLTAFTVKVRDTCGGDVNNARVYLFDAAGASYQGIVLNTGAGGDVTFELPDGSFQARVNITGEQAWSGPFAVAAPTETTVVMTTVACP